jgi:hypothetical protein
VVGIVGVPRHHFPDCVRDDETVQVADDIHGLLFSCSLAEHWSN